MAVSIRRCSRCGTLESEHPVLSVSIATDPIPSNHVYVEALRICPTAFFEPEAPEDLPCKWCKGPKQHHFKPDERCQYSRRYEPEKPNYPCKHCKKSLCHHWKDFRCYDSTTYEPAE